MNGFIRLISPEDTRAEKKKEREKGGKKEEKKKGEKEGRNQNLLDYEY